MAELINEMLGIRYPIIQGGMAWVATWELASAVSNAGGLGIIGVGGADVNWGADPADEGTYRQALWREFDADESAGGRNR